MTTPTPVAYPLAWPHGWPRTEPIRRERGTFKTSLPGSLSNLKREINLFGGKSLVLSSNYTLGSESVSDPGVCAYFVYENLNLAVPCDRWRRIEHNVQAISLTIEAMRGMKRWGASHMIRAMFTGFKALPQGEAKREWHAVLGVHPMCGPEKITEAYRELVKKHHPDRGGTHEEFIKIQNAYEDAQRMGKV